MGGASAVPAGGFALRSRAGSGISPRHYDRDGRCVPGLGQAKAGNTRKRILLAHDLFGKPVSTFPDHASDRVPGSLAWS
jgi:hypothetical protein